jgi:pSer/pThr/pTyr-binding forkhead associated (FHA) protein
MLTYFLDTGATRIRIGGGETIGRDPECTVVLNDEEASRRHAVMRLEGEVMLIEDLGSRNGTFVNGTRISEPTAISVGDRIKIGTCSFEVAESRQARQTANFETMDGSGRALAVTGLDEATLAACHSLFSSPLTELASTGDLARMMPFTLEALLVPATEVKRKGVELLGMAHWYHPAMPLVVLATADERPLAEALVAHGSHGAAGWLPLPLPDDAADKLAAILAARGGTTKLPERLDTLHPAYEGEERRACFRARPPRGEAIVQLGGVELDASELSLPQGAHAGALRVIASSEVAASEAVRNLVAGESTEVELKMPRDTVPLQVAAMTSRSQRSSGGLSAVLRYQAGPDAFASLARYWVHVQQRA